MHSKIGQDAGSTSSRKILSFKAIAKRFDSKAFRDAYVSRQLRIFLATQMRALRGAKSQSAFGKELGKPQSVISRLESEGYGNVTVRTLIEIAAKLNLALIVRFVSIPTFLRSTSDYARAAVAPEPYSSDAMARMIHQEERKAADSAWDHITKGPQRIHATTPGAYGAFGAEYGWANQATRPPSFEMLLNISREYPAASPAMQSHVTSAKAAFGRLTDTAQQRTGPGDETHIS